MIVKPTVPGTVIRDPQTRRRLPDDGDKVPRSSFWLRRLRAGEVVELDDSEWKAVQERRAKERRAKAKAAADAAKPAATTKGGGKDSKSAEADSKKGQ